MSRSDQGTGVTGRNLGQLGKEGTASATGDRPLLWGNSLHHRSRISLIDTTYFVIQFNTYLQSWPQSVLFGQKNTPVCNIIYFTYHSVPTSIWLSHHHLRCSPHSFTPLFLSSFLLSFYHRATPVQVVPLPLPPLSLPHPPPPRRYLWWSSASPSQGGTAKGAGSDLKCSPPCSPPRTE